MRDGPKQTPPLEHQKTHVFRAAALSPAECDRLVTDAVVLPEETAQLIGGEELRGVRRCIVRWLPEEETFAWVQERLIRLVADANREYFGFDLWGMDERLQFLEYEGGESGFFDWHIDRGRGGLSRMRKLSVSIQLSDPKGYEDGALELNGGGAPIAAPCEQGSAAVFAANMLHRVSPVSTGRRRALTAWFHGPHFR